MDTESTSIWWAYFSIEKQFLVDEYEKRCRYQNLANNSSILQFDIENGTLRFITFAKRY